MISTRGRYALRMMLDLAQNQGDGYVALRDIAARQEISKKYLEQIIPLLNRVGEDLHVSEFTANLIPMVTQIGYALGLLFIIPLGDLYKRRNIIVINFSLLACSMLAVAVAPDIRCILAASLVTGVCSVMPQIFIPMVSQFSLPQNKARNVGMLVSGLLAGILGSRVISGIVGEYWGWRTMYYIAALMMLVCIFVVLRILPDMPSNFRGTYRGLMKSLLDLFRSQPTIRMVSARSGLCFGSFLALWACLAFKLSGPPFYAGNNVIGMLGLCGVAGALTASFVGASVRRLGVRPLNFIGCGLMIAAWAVMYIFQDTYTGFIAGIILIDIGMQCVQISNQTCALSMAPQASSRVNTIFMTTYFVGGAAGTFLAGTCWHAFGWAGVAGAGVCLTVCSLFITCLTRH